MTLPDGVERRSFEDGPEALATRGPSVSDEPTEDGWRRWDPRRSKLAAMIEVGLPVAFDADAPVLYLGAAGGTTVSHVADAAGPTYAVEFAPGPMPRLVGVAEDRSRCFPLLKDAREPETYAHVVEPVDVLVQDVATRGQARVARRNRQFLTAEGRLYLAVKTRSEDVTRDPAEVRADVESDLADDYEILASESLAPYHDAHYGVVARPRPDGRI